MTIRKLPGSQIESNTITITQIQTTAVTNIVTQAGPRVTSLVYPGDDTAGNTVGGQTVYINGTGFETNNAIYINGNAVPSKSFISASNLSFTTPALSAGIYPVYVINTDSGSTAIFVPGYIASAEPAWVTSAGSLNASQDEASAWSYSLSATGDDPITYALADGSSLPTGISLASNGVISGTLSSPPGTETTYTFSVVATDAQNQDSTRQFTVTTSTGEGVLFANNVLLIHADGANNQNNHAFLDSSNNNFTITRYGNATQGSLSPFSQTGWSNYFDGNGDTLSYNPGSTLSGIGTGAFTIEAWVYFTADSFTTYQDIFIWNGQGMLLNSGQLRAYGFSSTTASSTITRNAWVHVAIVRQSNQTLKGYYNGVECFSTTSSTATGSSGSTAYVGSWSSGTDEYFPGYISNLRVSNIARYTSNFTPSTTALSSDANTVLLTCQSNRFIDNSSNNHTLTRNGDTSIQAFSPFAPTAAYSTANVGGSGYFDGSGDYLTVPAGSAFAPGTSDFTIEAWIYPTNSSEQYIWTQTVSGTNYFLFQITSTTGSLTMTTSGGGTPINGPANSIRPYAWNHVAAVRSGGTVTVYVNGVAGTPSTNAQDLTNTSYVPTIGTYTHNTSASPLTGYLASLRYVKGTAVYTTNFTPPTAPLTNIANTSFLCNYTNAGIFDQTAKNIIETQGDAKITTSVYKYGTGSIAFDGTGDRLVIPTNKNLDMTNNFTIEMWIYLTSLSSYNILFDTSANGTAGSAMTELWVESNGNLVYYAQGSSILTTNTNNLITVNAWHHIAVVKNGTSQVLYVNGVSRASATSSTLPNSGYSWHIGDRPASAGSGQYPITGYIDDFRITKGYARYTSNFTPPTAAFKDK